MLVEIGEGDLAFCSGGDQTIRGESGYKEEGTGIQRLNVLDFQREIRACPKPVIAMVAGWAVGGGDFDNDGYSDVALGARLFETVDHPGGVVAIFRGGASGVEITPMKLLDTGVTGSEFGISLAAGEDLDADGFDDLAVGARKFPIDGQPAGAAFVYTGGPAGLPELPAFTFTYGQADAEAGRPVAYLGDLDGDGTSELGISAFRFSNDQADEGVVFIEGGFADFLFADGFEG